MKSFTARQHLQHGFSLTELVMVMIILGILATYVVTRMGNAASITGSSQAQEFVRDLRHAQMLAITWGRPLIVTVTAGGYSVACPAITTAPCNTSPVVDPARGVAFDVALNNASFTATRSVRFDSFGRPSTGAAPSTADTSFTLSAGGTNTVVTVRAISGLVQ